MAKLARLAFYLVAFMAASPFTVAVPTGSPTTTDLTTTAEPTTTEPVATTTTTLSPPPPRSQPRRLRIP
ncbi:hypothetical protein CC2G_009824 [Coprinopsis cinerea AmutBmut pab1-1]|nr:hypothetical protein CC2G_009824 [Coprinopsis cinerea AmutBmut pab1-1]